MNFVRFQFCSFRRLCEEMEQKRDRSGKNRCFLLAQNDKSIWCRPFLENPEKSCTGKAKKQLHKQKKATILNNLPISSTNEASENKQPTEQRHSDRVRIRKKSAFQQQEICGEEARRFAGMRSRLDRRPIDQETGERISGSHQRIRMMLKENQPTTPNSSSNSSSISIDCSIRQTKLFQNSMSG